ncbi:MAG: DotA/TraY family protein [Paracoccus sp. (in: a-proteobacteria)]|uniref:DotA/TraY family protein n=1 Tax=Paracoccus sp. TaxID=267 RepID=UPI0026DEB6C9|nr:DotA/TraY family protein [Paracoccus sp. (in: a-proteobacteria)]MDO5631619.1 DotA/TraY family protein [Paracoccus sp. (in: a-proteobacteria)]
MEEYDFSSLFERSSGDYAGGILERLFGGIVPFLTGAADDLGTGNWLSSIFSIFNTAGLLCVLVVTSYTVYTVMFDSASDGKTFGQRTDTKYTITRILLGMMSFVPVAGGYSLAQVAMLWLVLQGSALGDVVWSRTAESALTGQPLLSQPQNSSITDIIVQGQFAQAYDALVLGHLCAINANSIYFTLNSLRADEQDAYIEQVTSGPLSAHSSAATEVASSPSWISIGSVEVGTLNHVIRFQEAVGSTAYSGRSNFCGGVTNSASLRVSDATDYSFADQVTSVQTRALFQSYVQTINQLSERAQSVAVQIHTGLRNTPTLEELARTHIREATNSYIGGAGPAFEFDDTEIAELYDFLLAEATERGWLFAPGWQRGISMAAASFGSPDGDLRLNAYRESNLTEYLSGQGVRTGWRADSIVRSMLAKADSDFETWDMMSAYVTNLGEPSADADDENYASMRRGSAFSGLLNGIYTSMLDLFNPVAQPGGNAGLTDPMVQVSQQGKVMLVTGGLVTGAGFGSAAAGGFLPSWIPFTGAASAVLEAASGPLITAGMFLMLFGAIIFVVVPMIPFIYYYSAVISWVMLVVESMFAVSLAVLTLFAPAREGTLIGSWNKILLSIFGIIFRPFFTVVGLIFSMMVIAFSLQYLYDLFHMLMDFITPGPEIISLVAMVGFLFIYVVVTCVTVLIGAQLITELGDSAMGWLGISFGGISQRMDVGKQVANAADLGPTGSIPRRAGLGLGTTGTQNSIVKGASNRLRQIGNRGGGGQPPK